VDPARHLTSTAEERRRYRRIKCQCATEVHPRGSEDEVLLSYSIELSAGGCFVRSNRSLPIGLPLTLEMVLDDARRMTVQGVILYSGPATRGSAEPGSMGFAVGFTLLEPAAKRALHEFLGDAAPPPARRAKRTNGHAKPKRKRSH
jgi:hypothetical protein